MFCSFAKMITIVVGDIHSKVWPWIQLSVINLNFIKNLFYLQILRPLRISITTGCLGHEQLDNEAGCKCH
jgi:hypothetical protein